MAIALHDLRVRLDQLEVGQDGSGSSQAATETRFCLITTSPFTAS